MKATLLSRLSAVARVTPYCFPPLPPLLPLLQPKGLRPSDAEAKGSEFCTEWRKNQCTGIEHLLGMHLDEMYCLYTHSSCESIEQWDFGIVV